MRNGIDPEKLRKYIQDQTEESLGSRPYGKRKIKTEKIVGALRVRGSKNGSGLDHTFTFLVENKDTKRRQLLHASVAQPDSGGDRLNIAIPQISFSREPLTDQEKARQIKTVPLENLIADST